MKQRKVMKLASRGKRFGAACIDAAIPAVVCFIFIITSAIEALRQYSYMQNFGYDFGVPGFGYGYGYSSGVSGGTVAVIIICFLILLAYIVVQLIFFNRSATIGKAALGLQVVSSKDGTAIGFWKMLFREVLVKKASEYVLLLGYIWILIDDRNRGWHDKILDTYVVDLRESAALADSHADRASDGNAPVSRPAPKSLPVGLQETAEVSQNQNSTEEAVIPLPGETEATELIEENEQE